MNFREKKNQDQLKTTQKNSIYIIVPAYILLPSPSLFYW